MIGGKFFVILPGVCYYNFQKYSGKFVNFYSLGISYKTAPIDVREKFYLTPIERELFLSEVKNDPRVAEAFILSTCNRTEIYANTID
ncbi:MAG: hypothetical protein COW13_02590, partial [Candidatus Omnitrophica bacterium CG12_big_fil_rev_8_21_14_0_65_50_5]